MIEQVPIGKLKAHPKNPNRHSSEQIAQLAEIIRYQGWRLPIIVSKTTGFIVSGHGRLQAAIKMGLKEVPVSYQEFLNDDQEYAFLVSDNAIASWAELDLSAINSNVQELGPEFDIDLLGIKDFEIEPADKLPPGCDEDEVPEHVEPITKLGDIYELGVHRLLCGDSTSIDAVEKLMKGEKAELCFTSPPYADQREYNGGKELSTEHLSTFIRTAIGKVNYFAINLGYSRKDGEVNQYWNDYIKEAKECGLKFLSWNIWDRGCPRSVGQQTAMFPIEHEWVFCFGLEKKDLNLTVRNLSAGSKTGVSNRQSDGSLSRKKPVTVREFRGLGTIIRTNVETDSSVDQPAKFPVEFAEGYVNSMTNDSDLIYEPFGGSGSTLIACEKTNRKCYMMELDPHYCDVIVARWEKYTGKKSVRIDG